MALCVVLLLTVVGISFTIATVIGILEKYGQHACRDLHSVFNEHYINKTHFTTQKDNSILVARIVRQCNVAQYNMQSKVLAVIQCGSANIWYETFQKRA